MENWTNLCSNLIRHRRCHPPWWGGGACFLETGTCIPTCSSALKDRYLPFDLRLDKSKSFEDSPT